MLPKSSRLSHFEFLQVKKSATTINHPLFSLLYSRSSHGRSRFSVVVSTRVAPKAHSRNQIRRSVYNSLPPHHSPAFDVIIFLKPKSAQVENEKLNSQIHTVLSEIRP
ncbi:hypothetical protein A2397_05155 [Candidatus Amesbacteria bacterium RIFOXYB1_FULL_44_23]|uniref:Uncharacterized protein n=1 Tax=Candidatus Amesbacteria bacterium RIFOXYB1_FULL_44_23 TaxID=1797263 RepID=A0A1F4ZQW5_9BACT|nr:MAG: hypothetical protein A2397_05155 [Candidatus Amesbacteria bacterium RIFOXYB1_FULL_44_23]